MSDPFDPDGHHPSVGNRYIYALWIFGGALIVGSVVGTVYAQNVFSTSYSYTGETPPALLIAQMIGGVTPNALIGGVFCVGLALATSAVVARLDRRVLEPDVARLDDTTEARDAASDPKVAEVVTPSPRDSTRDLDLDRFKRPSTASHHETSS